MGGDEHEGPAITRIDTGAIEHARSMADALVEQIGPNPPPLLGRAVLQLETALEELAVSVEELHEQHTELVTTREALEAERRHFQDLFDGAPDAYLLTDARGMVERSNTRAMELLRTPRASLEGRPLASLVVPAERPAFRSRLNLAAEGQPQRDWTVDIAPRGRPALVVSADVTPGEDATGHVELRWLLRDVTAARQAQEALQASFIQSREETEQLRELDRWKDTFLAAAAHDLRSPLAVIATAAESLLNVPDLDPGRQREIVTAIRERSARLQGLLEDLLDLDRFARGTVTADRRPVEVAALVQHVVDDLRVDDHPVEVDVVAVRADLDAMRVEQILTNLLRNAASHTPVGTPIRVAVESTPDAVVLTVEDEGPGLDPELGDTIFSPFVSAPRHAAAGRGTGIGLSLVQLFAQLHGGHVEARNRDGGGACFVVTLPAAVEVEPG